MSLLHLVVPDTVGDPRHPSGGNVYDAELAVALRALGQVVCEHKIPVGWTPDGGTSADLEDVLEALPAGSTVLVDGLVGLGAAEVLERFSGLRLWLLVHLPLGLAGGDRDVEKRALNTVEGVITTSHWARCWLLDTYGPLDVVVAHPGVQPAEVFHHRSEGGSLLCVGALVPAKGQDVLLAALRALVDLDWSCRLVGPFDRDRAFAEGVRDRARDLGDRVMITGPLDHRFLYGTADLLVVPTRLEMYGMVVTEALARGIPVIASDTGGVAEALGRTPDGSLPGALVPPGDAVALAAVLRRWFQEPGLRARWRASAFARREVLEGWSCTARTVLQAVTPSHVRVPERRGR